MADYIHLTNIIQGEVIRIKERRPLEQQPDDLNTMIHFLEDQISGLTIERLKVVQELAET